MNVADAGFLVADILAKKRTVTKPPELPAPSSSGASSLDLVPTIGVLAFVMIVILVVYFTWASQKRRRMAFIQLASRFHLTYSEQDPFGLLGYPFALFQRGDGQGVENVVHGMWQELSVVGFDYWYYDETTTKSGTSRTYHRFDCALVPMQAASPRLSIERENFLTKIADALSFHDIEFESEDFNDAFNVRSEDKKFANDLLDARMMEWLLASGSDYGYEVMGNRVLVAGPKIDPSGFPQLLGTARGFVDHVPSVVYSLYPG